MNALMLPGRQVMLVDTHVNYDPTAAQIAEFTIMAAEEMLRRASALVGASCDPYSHESVRATMGSIFNVPLVRTEAGPFSTWVARWPGDAVGTHLSAREDFRAAPYRGPVLLVMGSEGPGLSDDLARVCSRLVKIPMAGRLDSLNLAVATALVLYEIRRPRLHL